MLLKPKYKLKGIFVIIEKLGTPCSFGKLWRDPRCLPLSPPSLFLCCSAPPTAAPRRRAPALPVAPRCSNPTPWPTSSPPAARPTSAGFPRPATSCRRRPKLPRRVAGRQQLLQLARAPSCSRSTSNSLP
jgi:hypothetical protein